MDKKDVKRIIKKYEPRLLELKGAVGVGIGRMKSGQWVIEVLVAKKLPEHELVSSSLEGVPVRVREVGVIRAIKQKKEV